jgi:hypothetical protein
MSEIGSGEEFTVHTEDKNFGHGDVKVVEVIPPGISKEQYQNTRKLVFVPGHNPSGKRELSKLRHDLVDITEGRINADANHEPVIAIGVAFTGDRSKSVKLAEGLPEGVKVVRLQADRAKDLIAATESKIQGNNAEIVGYSQGGPIAQTAVELGLPADTVGLFSGAGLDDKNTLSTHFRVALEQIPIAFRRAKRFVKNLISRNRTQKSVEDDNDEQNKSFIDRKIRARAEEKAVGKARTHLLVGKSAEKQYIIGTSKKDIIYPRHRIKKILRRTAGANVKFVDLDWRGHELTTDPTIRKDRLHQFGRVMAEANERK